MIKEYIKSLFKPRERIVYKYKRSNISYIAIERSTNKVITSEDDFSVLDVVLNNEYRNAWIDYKQVGIIINRPNMHFKTSYGDYSYLYGSYYFNNVGISKEDVIVDIYKIERNYITVPDGFNGFCMNPYRSLKLIPNNPNKI